MVLLTTTPPILSAIKALPPTSRHDFSLPDTLNLEDPISHDQLIKIARYFRQKPTTDSSPSVDRSKTLNSLLRGTKVYVPPPPKKPEPVSTYLSPTHPPTLYTNKINKPDIKKSPEYLALKARLLAAAETDAYNRMTSSFSSSSFFPPSSRTPASTKPSIFTSSTPTLEALHNKHNPKNDDDNGTDPLTPGLVLNIFLSVLITGFSVYWALRSFRSPEMLVSTVARVWRGKGTGQGVSESVKVLVSLGAAVVVGVAEVMIYAIYLRKVEVARGRERRVKERKVVVGSERVGGGKSREGGEDGGNGERVGEGDKEEEVIWGRGVNGGLRRRVREKWEEKEKDSINMDKQRDKSE
ncbi:similar to An07g06590 [Aspergillus luchuensis]|uniref:Similar to An07g06590 n=1 Tax=Aspergillus kawachii TaxID=1069201 RepID=A0A146F206_ASPKA|nr:similar to An07g06590 [Aspergillus luchuensis IFO 4308]GAT19972.1 similar to An07g06590 [Aspergillus luchuensis]